jgi:hypothetical protein
METADQEPVQVVDQKPILFWIEDRRDTVTTQISIVREAQLPYKMYGTPSELMAALEDVPQIKSLCKGFLIDVMLFGVADLRSIGIYDAPTRNGVHAGYVFVDRVLRAKQSEFADKPVCFLTERQLDTAFMQDVENLRTRGGGRIEVVQKYKDSELEKFRKFLAEL